MITLNPFKKAKKASARGEKDVAERIETVRPEAAKLKAERRMAGVAILPHVTEKSAAAGSRGWYVFRVPSRANKIFVKQAIQDRYGVKVKKVRVANMPSKHMRLGRIEGRVPGFKKAMVKLAEGQSIEFA